ncbi:MAG: winged helix-turn-helix transcriptional regulator, partial [Chloroflexi bacterium]|nr:winged helix-turn-helix transcriptional regulator [Chloroflexota bacterium]
EETLITRGDLTIDSADYEVRLGGRRVDLTYREYQLLKYLASSPGRVLTRESLLANVWGADYYGGDRTLDVHIRRLRSKLEDASHVFIETVRNVGYKFKNGEPAGNGKQINAQEERK